MPSVEVVAPPVSTSELPNWAMDFLDSGIPAGTIGPAEWRRIRTVNIGMSLMTILCIPFAIQYFTLDLPWVGSVVALTGVLGLANILFLRITHRSGVSGHLVSVILYSMFVCSNVASGGFYDPNFGWFLVIPLVSAVVSSVRGATIWIVITILTTFGFWLLPEIGLPLTDHIPEGQHALQSLFNRSAAAFVSGFLIIAFVIGQRSAEKELLAADKAVKRLAYYDELTGLPNRTLFQQTLSKAIDEAAPRGEKVGLLFIDLDRFKNVNDSLGHGIGDRLLSRVGERFVSAVSDRSLLLAEEGRPVSVARLGGDEFTVMFAGIQDRDHAARVAEALTRSLTGTLSVDEDEMFASASIGVAIYPDDGSTVDELLRNADAAMYLAKRKGGSTFEFYRKGLEVRSQRLLTLEARLRNVVARDELRLVYQPIVDAKSERVTGLEALVRWDDGDGGVMPSEFIPIAESTGLIVEIGEWVLNQALADMASIAESLGAVPRLSVNVSPRQLRDPEFVARVERALAAHPDIEVEMEITETALLIDEARTLETLVALKEMGVSLALDDFGTGYSSLSFLRTFPIDRLKIDRSFTMAMEESERDQRIVRSVVSLAHVLNIEVVVEGVETIIQRELLAQMACEEYQGYLYSRPIARDEVCRFIARHHQDSREIALPERRAKKAKGLSN